MSGRRPALVALALTGALLTGCGGEAKSSSKDEEAEPTRTAETESASPTPTESATPEEREFAAGEIVLASSDISGLCAEALGWDPVDETMSAAHNVLSIRPSGTVLVECVGGPDYRVLAAVRARSGSLLWQRELATSGESLREDVLAGGDEYVYLASAADHPAVGLKAQFFTRTVTAIDEEAGTDEWTQPLEPNDTESSDTEGQVLEGQAPDGSQTVAIVNVNDFSAYAAADGKPLWRVPTLDPSERQDLVTYAANGRTIGVLEENDASLLVGTDLGSAKPAWTVPIDFDTTVVGEAGWQGLVGTSFWWIGERGYDAYDVATGKQTAHGIFPTSFTGVFASPTYTVAQVDGNLRAYRTGDWSKVLWSLESDSARASIATDKAVVVTAEAGTLLLDIDDGAILAEEFTNIPEVDEVTDGLFLTDDGDIMEIGKP